MYSITCSDRLWASNQARRRTSIAMHHAPCTRASAMYHAYKGDQTELIAWIDHYLSMYTDRLGQCSVQ